tara:strand:+ start:906 stop:1220 length:315 start_codon:yes stop_codon:yes gene_type:complete
MNNKIKKIITSITPSYKTSGSFQYPMPSEITLFLDNEVSYVEINLKDNVLTAEISNNDTDIELTQEDLDFIFKYLEFLFEEEIDLTKRYYEEEKYNGEQTYYIR